MRRTPWPAILALAVGAVSCERSAPPPPATTLPPPTTAATPEPPPPDVAVPMTGEALTRQEMERQRFSTEWQRSQSFQASPTPTASGSPAAASASPGASPAAGGGADLKFVTAGGPAETWRGIDPAALDTQPVRIPIKGDVKGPSVLRAQVLLDRAGFSPGAIDGRWGRNSQIAVYWFQRQNGLAPTGDVDEATFRALAGAASSGATLQRYSLTADDVKGPFTKLPTGPKAVYEKAKLDCLCYADAQEALAERFHITKELLAALNPALGSTASAGQEVTVPTVRTAASDGAPRDVQRIMVSVGGNYLHGLDQSGRIVLHAPTTVGSKYDPSPDETLKVTNISWNPDFHYQPTLFHEVPDSDPEAHLKPGPNSPVGLVWMALDKPHYGIHGTEDPDSIGYTSSHGCIRLTNWDATDLGHRLEKGAQVQFVDVGSGGNKTGGPSPVASPR